MSPVCRARPGGSSEEFASDPPGGTLAVVGIGTSLFLIAVGAILYFAVDADISGLEISTVGIILMVVGVLGLLISLFMLNSARRSDTVVRDREYR
jgi:Domain of unknown function (DUF6458)